MTPQMVCSDCSNENFAEGPWKVYGGEKCHLCGKRTICRDLNEDPIKDKDGNLLENNRK